MLRLKGANISKMQKVGGSQAGAGVEVVIVLDYIYLEALPGLHMHTTLAIVQRVAARHKLRRFPAEVQN